MTEVIERHSVVASKKFPKKNCTVCNKEWQPEDRYQSARNATCSKECSAVLIGRARIGKKSPMNARVTIICPECGTSFERAPSHVQRVSNPVCSKQCNGHVRSRQRASQRRSSHTGKG